MNDYEKIITLSFMLKTWSVLKNLAGFATSQSEKLQIPLNSLIPQTVNISEFCFTPPMSPYFTHGKRVQLPGTQDWNLT